MIPAQPTVESVEICQYCNAFLMFCNCTERIKQDFIKEVYQKPPFPFNVVEHDTTNLPSRRYNVTLTTPS